MLQGVSEKLNLEKEKEKYLEILGDRFNITICKTKEQKFFFLF